MKINGGPNGGVISSQVKHWFNCTFIIITHLIICTFLGTPTARPLYKLLIILLEQILWLLDKSFFFAQPWGYSKNEVMEVLMQTTWEQPNECSLLFNSLPMMLGHESKAGVSSWHVNNAHWTCPIRWVACPMFLWSNVLSTWDWLVWHCQTNLSVSRTKKGQKIKIKIKIRTI